MGRLKVNQERITALVASLVAAGLFITTWSRTITAEAGAVMLWNSLVALALAAGIAAAHKFPIHIQPHTKIQVNSVPLYLAVVLLPIPFALLCVGVAMLAGQWLVRKQRGTLPVDIVTTVARWIIVGYLAGQLAHWPASDLLTQDLLLFATALVMFLGDMITVSIQVSPWMGEPPWRLMVAAAREGLAAEGVQYLLAIIGAVVAAQQVWMLALLALPIIIAYRILKATKEMHDSTRRMLEGMADAVDLRDPYTGGHSRRVAEFRKGALKELGIFGVEADLIRAAARLHDIGKIGIPDAILNKPGPLTDDEWKVMQSHPERGAELLERYPDFARGADFVRYHHEHWDGTGYPRGIKGLDIPLGARVIAVADALDAMTSDRPYRPALTLDQALQRLVEGRGKTWDLRVVDAFIRTVQEQVGQPKPEPEAPPAYALVPACE